MIKHQAEVEESSQKEIDDVEDEVTVIVRSYAIVYPGAMVIMFCDTTPATLAMLASNWLPDHTRHTEILIVELPQAYQFVDHSLLLDSASKLRHVPWIFDHGVGVEVRTKSVRCGKK